MPYGTLKVDNITYTSGGSDASTSVSGIVALAAGNFNNVTATGTISGVTVTGITANFQSGVFTTQISGAVVAGPTHTGTTANFVSGVFTTQVSGATVAGPTHTGTTANFESGVFTARVSGATVTGNAGQFTNITAGGASFTSVTGTTVTGTTANFVSGVFTTQVSGATIAGPTHTGTTANFSSGNFTSTLSGVLGSFTSTLSGLSVRDTIGNVRAIPANNQASSYTLVTGDTGRLISSQGGVTVPANVFAAGDAISVYNDTGGNITITQGASTTLRQAGTSNTGNRTLATRGLAAIVCVATNDFVINGGGLS